MNDKRIECIRDAALIGAVNPITLCFAGMAGVDAMCSAERHYRRKNEEDRGFFNDIVLPLAAGITAGGTVMAFSSGVFALIADLSTAGTALQSVQRLAKYATVGTIGVATFWGTLNTSPEVLRGGLAIGAAGAAVYTACTRL